MKQEELLTTQLNASQQDNSDSSKIWERYQITNSPFWVIGNRTQGYNIIMGKYKLNKEPFGFGVFDEGTILHEANKWLGKNKWDIILSLAICVATDIITNKTN